MTPSDFTDFVEFCKERHGWTRAELAQHLGISKNMPAKYEAEGAPLVVALACAAIAAGIKPWPETKIKKRATD